MRRVESADTLDGEMVYKMAQAYAQLGDGESSVRLLRRSIEVNFYPSSYSCKIRSWRQSAPSRNTPR